MLHFAFVCVLADPTPLASKIADVTLYGTSALVHRTAEISGSGSFVLRGLPMAMDPSNVRVRLANGDVIGVEVRDRVQGAAPSERLQGLRDQLKSLRRDLKVAEDDVAIQRALWEHLKGLLRDDETSHANDVRNGRASPDVWAANYEFLVKKLAEQSTANREAEWKVEEKKQVVEEAERELGRAQSGGGVSVHDVIVDVQAGAKTTLDLEYLVGNTGWQPAYDLRAARDLSKVEMSYRARIWQETGEDWSDVELALSTARPQIGAQGPEARTTWMWLYDPDADRKSAPASAAPEETRARKMSAAGYTDADDKAVENKEMARPFASVESQGLSVRFKLARRESIESRRQPTTVLIGSSDLAIQPERWCVPALDTTVWLRGKTKNTSAWTLLPGPATVFLGADYLGVANLDTVQPAQEFTLHLGADPSLVVTRAQTHDESKGPGFLSSRAAKVEAWRVHLENHGSPSLAKDGAVEVFVRESLPKSRDERLEVELSESQPKPASDERWKQDAAEKGIQTWVVRVPRAGAADIVFETTLTYPKGLEIKRD